MDFGLENDELKLYCAESEIENGVISSLFTPLNILIVFFVELMGVHPNSRMQSLTAKVNATPNVRFLLNSTKQIT